MRPGLMVGQQAVIEVRVTPELLAQFDGKLIHPVYSTASMVYHMEWASRQIILPYLEAEEEGMGAAVTAKHLAPCPLNSLITFTATVSKLENHTVITTVEATNKERLVGLGEVKQVILSKKRIAELTAGT